LAVTDCSTLLHIFMYCRTLPLTLSLQHSVEGSTVHPTPPPPCNSNIPLYI